MGSKKYLNSKEFVKEQQESEFTVLPSWDEIKGTEELLLTAILKPSGLHPSKKQFG
jgi:hypothetical protein